MAGIAVEGLHHVTVNVTDLERAKRFYGEVLGLQEIERPPFRFGGAWYSLGRGQLHLIVKPDAESLRGTTRVDSMEAHFALRVRDYLATRAALLAAGVTVRENPRSITGWAQIYCCDPDGNVIELNVPQEGLPEDLREGAPAQG